MASSSGTSSRRTRMLRGATAPTSSSKPARAASSSSSASWSTWSRATLTRPARNCSAPPADAGVRVDATPAAGGASLCGGSLPQPATARQPGAGERREPRARAGQAWLERVAETSRANGRLQVLAGLPPGGSPRSERSPTALRARPRRRSRRSSERSGPGASGNAHSRPSRWRRSARRCTSQRPGRPCCRHATSELAIASQISGVGFSGNS